MWSECAREKGYGHSYPDNIEVICKSEIMTSERKINEHAFAYARGKHAMRYTHHRGLSGVTRWVRLSYAAINLKSWKIRAAPTLFCVFILAVILQKMTTHSDFS